MTAFILLSMLVHSVAVLIFWGANFRSSSQTVDVSLVVSSSTVTSVASPSKSQEAPRSAMTHRPRIEEAAPKENTADVAGKKSQGEKPPDRASTALEGGGSKSAGEGLRLKILYPSMALYAREEGRAEYHLNFSKRNHLIGFRRIKSTGYARLDQAVEQGLEKALVNDGEPVYKTEKLTIDFRLERAKTELLFSLN